MRSLVISNHPDGVRTALVQDGRVEELFVDPSGGGSWVGRVILGRVLNILPGRFCFVDIGAEKSAFLNLRPGHKVKIGQPILVQVYKDASGLKGMYAGTELRLKGRLVILHDRFHGHVGVSAKIRDTKEIKRLKGFVRELLPRGYGAIVRTNAAGEGQPAIADEIHHLHQMHIQIRKRARYATAPTLLYPESTFTALNMLSDILSSNLDEIVIGGDSCEFEQAKTAIVNILPGKSTDIRHHTSSTIDVFDAYNINTQIAACLSKNHRLPCGGFVTFEETEACVVIDVNTGSNFAAKESTNTVLETNIEAARVIAAQIRLRNLSGIIIVDFIDMNSETDKKALLLVLQQELNKDRIRIEIVGMIGLGMVQITRTRTRPPISTLLQVQCEHCRGTGRLLGAFLP